jgi:hypothetical protein
MLIKRAMASALVFCPTVFLYFGCEQNTENATISQFDRPQNVAFVCFDSEENEPLPINCCKTALSPSEIACASHAASAKLYAFVTQTNSGEVAVVDVEKQSIVDQEQSIPYNTFIPVGGLPADIAATDDGTRVLTANFETKDLSIIEVVLDKEKNLSVINQPFLSPAKSIDLGGQALKMALVKFPEAYKDRFVLVTQPLLGQLQVVALNGEDCPSPENSPDGCLLGYVELPVEPDPETGEERLSQPSTITVANGQSVYVGSYLDEVLWDVQIESLVSEALKLEKSGAIAIEKVLNETISIESYTVRAMSLEPTRRRWIYAIDGATGGVIAIDLQNRIYGEKPGITQVSISGKARSLSLVELEEEGDPGPKTFNGTFAIVATTQAEFGVVDVEDNKPTIKDYHPHMLRSVVDLSDQDAGVPRLEDDPTLTVDEEKIDSNNVAKYIAFVEDDAGNGCDAGEGFKAEYDHGIRFNCDPYKSKRETWSLDWEGTIGVSGLGVITNIANPVDESGLKTWKLLNEDESKDYCASEVYPEGSPEGYPGDRLVITSKPTPDPGAKEKCDSIYGKSDELSYRIIRVSKYDEAAQTANVIEFQNDKTPGSVPDLEKECFGQALNYEIRASGQWIVKGTRSSYSRRSGVFKDGICDYTLAGPSKMRMNEGQPFENDYLKFRMKYQDEWVNGPIPINSKDEDTDMEVTATCEFSVINGYEEMYRSISGSNITDIEFTPDKDIAFVDQAHEGLIMFDMLNSFNIIGGNVN